ncbi:MAG TPA: hypothetical protein VLT33_10740 [Labilithrix sp.]|nr:hypothetical protein [Labilithrix sp.]
MTDIDYSAAQQLSPAATIVFFLALNVVLLGTLANAVRWMLRHARQAREASASVSSGDPSAPGHTVLYGTVETTSPELPAVTVTVREHGTEHVEKSSYSYTWKEFDRRVEVEPFTLVLASGMRVRVEPDPDVFLVDKLVVSVRGNPRTRRASLDNGELAYVDGVLKPDWQPQTDASQVKDGGALYRDAPPSAFVMTNGVERMLISTEPLARRHQRRSDVHRMMAILVGLLFVFMNTAMFGSAHLINVAGTVVETRLRAKSTWDTHNKGATTTHYGVRAAYADPASGREIEVYDEVSFAGYTAAADGQPVPFRVVLWRPSLCAVGTGATIGGLTALIEAGMVAFFLVFNWKKVRAARDWYDQTILEEHGRGQLQI